MVPRDKFLSNEGEALCVVFSIATYFVGRLGRADVRECCFGRAH